ncbi:MAG: glycoside hydrolase family 116 protein [Oscillospiraceae bacterium]|nr:glycoside hydrolase family 116 protein [Oscillospiraceae bacterium]
MLPPGRKRSGFRPCADGQLGGVVKVYRDWKISGDDAWLKRLWPQVKRCIAYAWSEGNPDRWDSGKTGVLTGRQHHTLDMELFGPNSWLTGFYLAALKSAAEMAGYLEDWEAGAEYTELFAKGKRYVEENLFNGEFFFQKIDLKDRSVTASFRNAEGYWNEEAGETKYQIGEGCGIDQVVAQWHANICGLGEIFDREKVRSALRSVYRYNYVKDFRSFFNPCRIYCLNGETGTVICSWPDADKKPLIPVPYAEETMHGFEYQLAAHMLQEGMIREGTELIKAVRDRYDGEKRNPWNELECGSNYARSMSVYTALTAFSGFTFDSPGRAIGFNPVAEEDFQCFWCLNTGWGMFEKNASGACVRLLYGEITLRTVRLPFLDVQRVALNGEDLAFGQSPGVTLEEPVTLRRGDVLAFYADTDVSAGGNTIKGRDTL